MSADAAPVARAETGDLDRLWAILGRAHRPEDIFGPDPRQARATYRRLARQAHPDVHPDTTARATQMFVLLGT